MHPVLDVERLQHLAHGDRLLAQELLAGFECECLLHLPRLSRALRAADRDVIGQLVARLRASCAIFGALALAALLHEIERWHDQPEAPFGEWSARVDAVWLQLHRELRRAQSTAEAA